MHTAWLPLTSATVEPVLLEMLGGRSPSPRGDR